MEERAQIVHLLLSIKTQQEKIGYMMELRLINKTHIRMKKDS